MTNWITIKLDYHPNKVENTPQNGLASLSKKIRLGVRRWEKEMDRMIIDKETKTELGYRELVKLLNLVCKETIGRSKQIYQRYQKN